MTEPVLTRVQSEALHLFFSLPESQGFLLAGGAGLVVIGLSDRPTEDLDLFAAEASIPSAGEALEAAARSVGWSVERLHDADTFRRLLIRTGIDSATMVDLAKDAGPLAEPTITTFGPTYPAGELAARKVLALFDRAALRDFIDVDRVAASFSHEHLIEVAMAIDSGLDVSVLAQMMRTLERFSDEQIAEFGVEPAALRDRFRRWTAQLDERP